MFNKKQKKIEISSSNIKMLTNVHQPYFVLGNQAYLIHDAGIKVNNKDLIIDDASISSSHINNDAGIKLNNKDLIIHDASISSSHINNDAGIKLSNKDLIIHDASISSSHINNDAGIKLNNKDLIIHDASISSSHINNDAGIKLSNKDLIIHDASISSSHINNDAGIKLSNKDLIIHDASISSSHHINNDAGIKLSSKDLISNLPSNILHHILSFLPTKDAVKTSILSTKWRYLWTYLSIFDFEFNPNQQNHNLANSLLDLLTRLFHKKSNHILEIEKLTIKILEASVDVHKLHSLISTLMNHRVQHLQLYIDDLKYLNTSFVLPSSTHSLNKLSLQLGFTLNIPNGIRFPSLKSLNLTHAVFANDKSFDQFISGCSVLQELTLNNCYWLNMKEITIAISTLRILTINYDRDCRHINCSSTPVIKIDVVNLLSLTCTSSPTLSFIIVNPLMSIVDAHIGFASDHLQLQRWMLVSHRGVMLLRGLASVKSLTLSNNILQAFSWRNTTLDLLPEFYNLTHLYLHSESNYFNKAKLMEILLRCPKLEVLVVPMGYGKFEDVKWTSNSVPYCFKSSLKILGFSSVDGFEDEIKWIKFLLEKARVLEEIKISCGSFYKILNLKKLVNDLLQLVGLESCRIIWQYL